MKIEAGLEHLSSKGGNKGAEILQGKMMNLKEMKSPGLVPFLVETGVRARSRSRAPSGIIKEQSPTCCCVTYDGTKHAQVSTPLNFYSCI